MAVGYKKVPANDEGAKNDAEADKTGDKKMMCVIIVMVVLLVLATIDSFTTKFFKSMCAALALWTMQNAPGSFIAYELIIFLFLVFCLPYGPLGVLSGALFYQKYGAKGVVFAWLALFFVTTVGAAVAFYMARNYFRESVQKQIDKNPKLGFLKNLDKLIANGQGIEMVVLIRLAPLPKGPTNYFLGTTAVTWRDFLIGTVCVNLPMSLIDVCIGAGAGSVKKDSPVSVAIFICAVALFLCFICFVGNRAAKKLKALEDEDEKAEGGAPVGAIDDAEAGRKAKNSKKAKDSKKLKKKTASSTSLLDKLDALQVVGKPNAWAFPDARLVLQPRKPRAGEEEVVSSCTVQLTSATFSFQVVSARVGWRLRLHPKDGALVWQGAQGNKPGVLEPAPSRQASQAAKGGGLLQDAEAAEPGGGAFLPVGAGRVFRTAAVCDDGSARDAPGHGHNFHVVENAGDLVTIYVGRSLAPEKVALKTHMTLTEAQAELVKYEVWYEVERRRKLPSSYEGERGEGLDDFERFECSFAGGDGIDLKEHAFVDLNKHPDLEE